MWLLHYRLKMWKFGKNSPQMKLVGNMANIFKRSAFFVPLNVKICRQIRSQTFFSFERGRKACAHGLWRLHLAGLKRGIIGNKLLRNVIAHVNAFAQD
jgi:hypothetical protein